MLIPVNPNQFAMIDDEDFELVSRYVWHISYYGYAISGIIFMHRLILGLSVWDTSVDHINGNKLDNHKSNLRKCTVAQNIYNSKICSRNKSGYKGVYWNKEKGKWSAQIKYNRKSMHIGYFKNKNDAALAYNRMALRFFGEFARLNNVP
jgi:hypothetical protein